MGTQSHKGIISYACVCVLSYVLRGFREFEIIGELVQIVVLKWPRTNMYESVHFWCRPGYVY